MRPSWDEYFMEIAEVVSKRSTCTRRNVGAVLVKDRHIISCGYNGPHRKSKHCSELGCVRDEMKIPSGTNIYMCRAVHAEQNTISLAARSGVAVIGSTLYTTLLPCKMCTGMIVNAGIIRVVYRDDYPNHDGHALSNFIDLMRLEK